MEPFRHHVFICDQDKPDGAPCCKARGSAATIAAFRREIASRGLMDEVQLTVCGSLGVCERGPNMVVYPEGVWYSAVTAEDVAEIVESHFHGGTPVARLRNDDGAALAAEVRRNRDRAIAAMRAREASPLPPENVMQILRGFQESRILLTALELDVFTAAGAGAGAGEIAERIGANPRATGLLLDALAAMDLVRKEDGRYFTTPVTEKHFSARSASNVREAMLHQSSLWPRWSALTACVREGTSVGFEELAGRDESWTKPFIALMHLNAAERAGVVVPAVGTAGIKRMLDAGGGSGAYSIAFAKASSDLHAEILDLETVLPIARSHIEEAGLSDRVTTRAGDLRTGSFGSGYDLVFVSAICHAFGEDENASLVKRAHDALSPGGRLVIQDFILDETRASPKMAAIFSINMLVGTPRGRDYAGSEYEAWMKAAGFEDVRRIPLPGPTDLIEGKRR